MGPEGGPRVNMHWLLEELEGVRETGSGWMACCPAHDDRNPSLSLKVSEDASRILVHCFAGCEIDEICAALRIEKRDLFLDNGDRPFAGYRREDDDNAFSVVTAADFAAIHEPGAEPLVGEPGEVLVPEDGDVIRLRRRRLVEDDPGARPRLPPGRG